MLASYVHNKNCNWAKMLPYVTFAYNTSVNKSTKFSLCYLIYGYEPRFPLKLATRKADYVGVGGSMVLAEQMEHEFIKLPNLVNLKKIDGHQVKQIVHVNRLKVFHKQGTRPMETPVISDS